MLTRRHLWPSMGYLCWKTHPIFWTLLHEIGAYNSAFPCDFSVPLREICTDWNKIWYWCSNTNMFPTVCSVDVWFGMIVAHHLTKSSAVYLPAGIVRGVITWLGHMLFNLELCIVCRQISHVIYSPYFVTNGKLAVSLELYLY